MKVTTERLPDCEVKLTVEIEAERLEKPLRQMARELSHQVRIPGFRPGRAPFNVIVRRLGREALLGEVVEREGQSWYEEALEEAEMEPYDKAQAEITSYDPLVMTFTLPVAPVVDLGKYRDLRLDWQPPVVSDEDVEKELARLQQATASLEPRERPAELEDVVTLDIEGRIGDEVVVDVQERAVTLKPGINYPLAGFAEKIVGSSPGEDREFSLTYPADHPNAAWAGQEAHFKVHMHNLKVRVTPELDDELARTMGDYETLDEWRASIREQLEAKALEQAEHDYADSVVDALVEQAHIEFPATVVERQLDSMMEEADESLQQRGLGLENYLVMTGQNREDYRESLRETAEKRTKRGLALTELIEVERLEVSETDIEAEIDRMAKAVGDQGENFRKVFDNEKMRESLRNGLLSQAALETLKDMARGEYVPQDTPEPEPEEEGEGKPAPEDELAEMVQEVTEESAKEEIDEAPSDEASVSDG